MLESAVEARLTARVRRLGGLSVKLAPTVAGLPDRLVILPGGEVWLIEVKTDSGHLRPAQRVWLARLRKRGANVAVLYGTDDVNRWAEERQ